MKYAALYERFTQSVRSSIKHQVREATKHGLQGFGEALEDTDQFSSDLGAVSSPSSGRSSSLVKSPRKPKPRVSDLGGDSSLNDPQLDALAQDRLPVNDPSVNRDAEQAFRGGAPMDGAPDVTVQKFADGSIGGSISGQPGSVKSYSQDVGTTLQWARDVVSGKNSVPAQIQGQVQSLLSNYNTFKNDKGATAQMQKRQLAAQIAQLQAASSEPKNQPQGDEPQSGGLAQSSGSTGTFNPDIKPSDFMPDEEPPAEPEGNALQDVDDAIIQTYEKLLGDLDVLRMRSYLNDDERKEIDSIVRKLGAMSSDEMRARVSPENISQLLQITRAFRRINAKREEDYYNNVESQFAPMDGDLRQQVRDFDFADPTDEPPGGIPFSTEPAGALATVEKPGQMSRQDRETYALKKAASTLTDKDKALARLDREPIQKVDVNVEDPIDVETKTAKSKESKTSNVANAARKSRAKKESGDTEPKPVRKSSQKSTDSEKQTLKPKPRMKLLGTKPKSEDKASVDTQSRKDNQPTSPSALERPKTKNRTIQHIRDAISEVKQKIRKLAIKLKNKSLTGNSRDQAVREMEILQKKLDELMKGLEANIRPNK